MADKRKSELRARWPESASRPVATPIQPSVVYASQDPDALDCQYEGLEKGYTYAREGHPNADVLAALLDRMEKASGGTITSSGMAAVTVALLSVLKAGDHAIGADQLYGRSLRVMTEELPRLGVETSLIDPTDLAAAEAAIRPNTRLILVETVSNPTLRIADLDGLIALARKRNVTVAVDNTFPTPRGVQPLENGADIVLHSVTKLLAGHSDATLGYVVARDADLNKRIAELSATLGVTPSPFDCWLAERGLYSFEMRYERAAGNALSLADALAEQPSVKRVFYPGRHDHPDHNRATQLLGGEGGNMVSFEIGGGRDAANTFVRAADSLNFAPTLGDIATTISHPASSSHRALSEADRNAIGITQGFFRVSVGCEAEETLLAAFADALNCLPD
ncbi:MAG: trans-sulfuration enzyme family protein [Boseongicola sp.]